MVSKENEVLSSLFAGAAETDRGGSTSNNEEI